MKVWNINDDGIPSSAVYIGRGSPYGNPYVIGKDGTRDEVCDLFEINILPTLNLSVLLGKDLVCHCKPKRCHGDSIVNKLKPNLEDFFG